MKEEIIGRLKKIGVAIHRGYGYNPIAVAFAMKPICALWYESEEPTEEEIIILERIVKKKLEFLNPESVKDFKVQGENTLILKKEKGKWAFRRLTWRRGLWSTDNDGYKNDGSLTTIEKEI